MTEEGTISYELRKKTKLKLAKARKRTFGNKEQIHCNLKGWGNEYKEMPFWTPEKRTEYNKEVRESWSKIIPIQSKCQMCGKDVYHHGANRSDAINFDHRNEGNESIGNRPTQWLRDNKATPETIKMWEDSDFGILCGRCNKFLPTKNRKEFIIQAIKYIYGEEIKEKFVKLFQINELAFNI